MNKHKILNLATITLLVGIITVQYTYASFNLTTGGSVTVTAGTTGPPPIEIFNGNINGVVCTVASGSLSLTCPPMSFPSGSSQLLEVTLRNNQGFSVSVSTSATSSNLAILTVTTNPSNPTTISAGSTAIFHFTLTGVTQGSATYGVTFSG